MFLKACPDLKVNVEEMIAERDIVARTSMDGTHRGEFMGPPPAGKKVTFHGIDIIRLRDGKAAEVWHQGDAMMVLPQLSTESDRA